MWKLCTKILQWRNRWAGITVIENRTYDTYYEAKIRTSIKDSISFEDSKTWIWYTYQK